jgi:hypothetical protein
VHGTKLRNILNEQIWKHNPGGHNIGNGSSVDAAIREGQTRRGSGPTERFHEQTLVQAENGLNNVLADKGTSSWDRAVAYEARQYVQQSLRQFDLGVDAGRMQIGTGHGELTPNRVGASINRFEAAGMGTGPDAAAAWEPSGQIGPAATEGSGSGAAGDEVEVPEIP